MSSSMISSASAVSEPRSAASSQSSSHSSEGRRIFLTSMAYPMASAIPPTIRDSTKARSATTAGSALAAVADRPGATRMT